MRTLFAETDPSLPGIPGLLYKADFLDRKEHDALLALIDRQKWMHYGGRRIQPYGGREGETREPWPLPPWGKAIARRLYDEGLMPYLCDQLLVNEYEPGQGIGAHIDKGRYDDAIANISLGSAYLMDLVPLSGLPKQSVFLEKGSCLILGGDARWKWMHGIAKRKKDMWNGVWFTRGRRVSVTLRRTTG